MTTRRAFLGSMTAAPVAASFAAAGLGLLASEGRAASIARELAATAGSASDLASDEDFWMHARQAFTIDRSIINFNNGGVSPSPAIVQDAMKRHLDFSNECPPYNMWRILEPRREQVRTQLAAQWGVDREEIAITRNTSESLQICQQGMDLEPGAEVITSTVDYPRMVTTFRQRERRDGIKLVQVQIPVPAEDNAEIVRIFEDAITDKTRLILCAHMVNLTGQILPVREIAAMARKRGIPVIVDGAHAVAHFDFKLSDLDVDYYGTSLHKWLFAPHGTGMLYVRRDKIRGLWPMMAADESLDDDIRKFEQIGTHPAANALAISEALAFHQGIGGERKQARLVALREMWMSRLAESDRVHFNTSRKSGFACAIGNIRVDGIETPDLQRYLWTKHRILTVAIGHEECTGLRVSPSIYATSQEIDRFCDAAETAMRDGIEA